MPKYLFTSDTRISQLSERIQWVAKYVNSGESLSKISDKSDNNNATTLQSYFNLRPGTQICSHAETNPIIAIRNFVKRFQFPNVRTQESFKDCISEGTILAPLRVVVTCLYLLSLKDQDRKSYLSYTEVLYFVFCLPQVHKNILIDYPALVNLILGDRTRGVDHSDDVRSLIEWKQYDRQSRELLTIASKAANCIDARSGKITFSMPAPSDEDFADEMEFLFDVIHFNDYWIPNPEQPFKTLEAEYIKYMDGHHIEHSGVVPVVQILQPLQLIDLPKELQDMYTDILTAIATKPFILLAGISGTGKSRIVRQLAQATDDIDNFANESERFCCQDPQNFKLIQVKPNWHNSLDLIGYKSNINGEHYEFTPFIEFIIKAWLNPNTPFFLCLDEMNLAPVEEYFAEYLSAIESRSVDDNGNYETDPIIKPFDDYKEPLSSKMIAQLLTDKVCEDVSSDRKEKLTKRLKKKGLTLPKNLIVMGTVNMDETTFSFSRKVLDRAMSIEMNDVVFDSCITPQDNIHPPVFIEHNKKLVDRQVSSLKIIEGNNGTIAESPLLSKNEALDVKTYFEAINKLFEGTPFKLGYRACNEALLYIRAAKVFSGAKENYYAEALDTFTLMKILSRLEGDESKMSVDEEDDYIVTLGDDKKFKEEVNLLTCLRAVIKKNLDAPKSIKKVEEMCKVLKRDHFVSFWG